MPALLPRRPHGSAFFNLNKAEFAGTFFLVLSVVVAASQKSPNTPFSAGFTLLTQVFTYGYISGGMFNPAVSFGIFLVKAKRGEETGCELVRKYAIIVVVQCVAAILAALVGFFLTSDVATSELPIFAPAMTNGKGVVRAFVAELLWTYLLVSTVLHCAVSKATPSGNSYYGLGIGMSVLAGAFTVGSFSGGAFNPAVAIGAQVGQCIALQACEGLKWFWLYWVSAIPAAYFAALSFSFISHTELDDETETRESETLLSKTA